MRDLKSFNFFSRRTLLTVGFGITGVAVNDEPCSSCVIVYSVTAGLLLFLLLALVGLALHKRLKFRRAVSSGSIPASMLMGRWNVPANERGDIDAFAFKVSRPATRAAVAEEFCPICFGTKPKPANWVVFGACGHSTCTGCFKKLASQYRLHAACPLCRTLLATGSGARGGQRKLHGREQAEMEMAEGAAASSMPGGAPTPAQGPAAALPSQPGRNDTV